MRSANITGMLRGSIALPKARKVVTISMSAPLSQAQSPGYVHVSVRNAARRAEVARRRRSGSAGSGSGTSAGTSGTDAQPRTAPVPVMAPNGAGPQVVHPDVVARGFVIYVGLDEDAATGAGTSLHKIATELRDYVEHISSEAQVHIAMAMASAAAEGSDLEVVRHALGDPTVNGRSSEPAPLPSTPPVPSTSGVLIDLARREVKLDGEGLNLTYKEFELLNYLVDNAARTVGREELLKTLWRDIDVDQMPNERTIDVHIRRLRSKLGRLANTVRTIRGQGYRFYEHPEVTVWAAPEYSI